MRWFHRFWRVAAFLIVSPAPKCDGFPVSRGRAQNIHPTWSAASATILCSRGLGSMTLVTFPAPPA
jgi:hypothetical protein